MLIRNDVPHCPRCKGKPTSDQHVVLKQELGELTGPVYEAALRRFPSVYRCGSCETLYAYSHGFSTSLGRLRARAR
jgi:hypothetical protein